MLVIIIHIQGVFSRCKFVYDKCIRIYKNIHLIDHGLTISNKEYLKSCAQELNLIESKCHSAAF